MIDEKEELIGEIESSEDLNGEMIASGEVIASMIAQKGGKGDTGADGQDGYTPIKGVDYFTEEDIESLNIPSKTSELDNDEGFITDYTETDPIFTSSDAYGITSTDISNWNSKSEFSGSYNDLTDKPTLFSGDYEDLTNKPTIPNELSDLSDDSTHRLVSDTEKSTWNNKSDFSGNYNDLTNKPSIPTKVSDLNNDTGFITNSVNDLTNYTKSNDLSTVATSGSYNDLSNTPTIPTKTSDLTNDSNFMSGMTILAYGKSTWNDFITAYTNKHIVYCRASSSANPASGSQTRMAFMAYVNNETSPTSVEFQYVRSISSHSATQQGDQVFVYTLTSTNGGTWAVQTREMSTKIVPSTGLSSSYSSGTLTITCPDKEVTTNKVTSLSSSSTDTQYPSAKCVYDLVGDIESLLSEV